MDIRGENSPYVLMWGYFFKSGFKAVFFKKELEQNNLT